MHLNKNQILDIGYPNLQPSLSLLGNPNSGCLQQEILCKLKYIPATTRPSTLPQEMVETVCLKTKSVFNKS
jgi:hypothetical protein